MVDYISYDRVRESPIGPMAHAHSSLYAITAQSHETCKVCELPVHMVYFRRVPRVATVCMSSRGYEQPQNHSQ